MGGTIKQLARGLGRVRPITAVVLALLWGALIAQLIHISSMHLPLGQAVLRVEPVSFSVWLALLGLAFTVLAGMELHKFLWARRHGTPSRTGTV